MADPNPRVVSLPVFLLPVVLLAMPAVAQEVSVAEVALSAMSTERKAIVADRMRLTNEEARAFWPIYDDYLHDHEDLTRRLGEIVRQLGREFETLDDETALDLLTSYHEFREDRLELRWETAKKLRKKLGAKRAGRLYQIENKLDTMSDMDLVRVVPLVD